MQKFSILTKRRGGDDMMHISKIDVNPQALAQVKAGPVGSEDLSHDQRQAVGYFFTRLKMADSIQYDIICPDSKTEALVKREYASYIANLSQQQIDYGFAKFHEFRQTGDQDFKFISIDKIIGLASGKEKAGKWQHGAAAYKAFPVLALPDKGKKERAKEAHQKAMAELRGRK